ncbi:MAG: 50S ribosomal protein L21 [Oscillospiraceae bacterium]|nr:50S ribosomal protein L21 [Oscillospiraceae bacterium]
MTHAIIETGGKQYRVKEGDLVFFEKIPVENEETIAFSNVLAILDDENIKIGSPYVEGASVEASVLKHGKSKKIIVYKMHPKKGYRRKQGHRQPYTKARIERIIGAGVSVEMEED